MNECVTVLIDKVNTVKDIPTGVAFLRALEQHFEAQSVSYHGLNLPQPTHGDYYVLHTYSPDWEHCYVENNLFNVDPILRHGLASITPIDWTQLKDLSQKEKSFLAQRLDYGIGKRGLTFTVRGPFGDIGVFSVNTNHSKNKWASYKNAHMSDLHLIATYFHESILRSQDKFRQKNADILTERELECLKWCTVGKSYWETSVILGISERTVNFHMTTVRQKLNAMSNAQAVAKAVIQGIVSLS